MVVQCNESIHIVHIHIFRSITTNKQNKEKKERKRKQKRKNTAIHVNVHFYPSPDMPWYFGLDIRWKVSVVRPSRPATVFLKSISHATKSRVGRRPSERNSNRSLLKIVHSNSTVSSYCFFMQCVCASACECFVKRPRVHVGSPCTCTPSPRWKSPCANPYMCDTIGSGDAFRFRICGPFLQCVWEWGSMLGAGYILWIPL